MINLGEIEGKLKMKRSTKARRMLAAIVIALFASFGTGAALADNTPVSERDAIEQGVVLYEKMSGESIEYPAELSKSGYDDTFLKSVVMGYDNLEDFENLHYNEYIRKQDFMNILYKTKSPITPILL